MLSIIHRNRGGYNKKLDQEWSENLDGFASLNYYRGAHDRDPGSLLWGMLEVPVLLVLIGCSSALLSYFTNTFVAFGNQLRWHVLEYLGTQHAWLYYTLWSLMMSMIACTVTIVVCPEAAGGGVPEMKTILSGVVKPVLLSLRLVFAKSFGLMFALLAGLSVGKEGPFIQIAAAMADLFMSLSIFRHIRQQDNKRLEIIACACASGIAATFGAAFGGVLFSIEFTASAYRVQSLPKAFLTSVCAMLCFNVLGIVKKASLFNLKNTVISEGKYPTKRELGGFFLLGIGCAVIGIAFVLAIEVSAMQSLLPCYC